MICGTFIFEVGANSQPVAKSKSSSLSKSIPLKIPILIGIPVLILIVLGASYSLGSFDNVSDSSPNTIPPSVIEDKDIFYGEFDSKCGAGTVLDPETNSCRVGSVMESSSSDIDSKCGPGTIFDSKSNSCIVE